MKIRKIFLDYGGYPMRWLVVLDNYDVITIRERGNQCVVYKGCGSIFYVKDDEIILDFESTNSADWEVLTETIEKLNAEVMTNTNPYEYYHK